MLKKYCVHCLKAFETEHNAQEFCKPECRAAQNLEEKKERRKKRIELRTGYSAMADSTGNNYKNSDEWNPDDIN